MRGMAPALAAPGGTLTTDANDTGSTSADGGMLKSYTRKITVSVTHHRKDLVRVRSVLEDPDHLMVVEMDVGVPNRRITRASLRIEAAPFPRCRGSLARGKELEGLSIERGFAHKAAELVGGRRGCAHLFETVMSAARLASSAVTAVAAGGTSWDTLYHDDEGFRSAMAPYLKDTCIVFSDAGGDGKGDAGSGEAPAHAGRTAKEGGR